MEARALKPSELVGALVRCAKAGQAAFVFGSPGCGKSAVINTMVAPALGLPLVDFRLNSKEPVDLRGLPVVMKEGEVHRTSWASPDDLPIYPAYILFDEANTVGASMQAPFYQIVQERRLGNWVAHPDTRIVAAGNQEMDRAVAHKLSTALSTRFVRFTMRADLDDWIAWAVKTESIEPIFIAFLRFRPELFDAFNPAVFSSPIPRTIHAASNIYRQHPPEETIFEEIAGCVGDGFAGEFIGFLKVWRHLPDIDAILRKPDTFVAPTGKDGMSAKFAIAAAVSFKMTKDNIGNALQVLQKLGEEFAVFAVRDALRRDDDIRKGSKDFARWGTQVSDLLG